MKTNPRTIIMLLAHVTVGVVIVWSLQRSHDKRAAEVEELRRLATAEHASTVQQEHDLAVQQNILQALRRKDPYVIEMIARVKHGFVGANEVIPPMIDADDPAPHLPSNHLEP